MPPVASDKVYKILRRQIINGEIHSGAALKQDEIAAQHGMSKIPVREALRRLEVEGLVEFRPRRGAIVRTIDVNDVLELLDIRLALECRALELSIPNMADSDIYFAQEIHREYAKSTNSEDWSEFNRNFHHTILEPCGNNHLLSLLLDVEQRMGLLMRFKVTEASGLKRPILEHEAILNACEQRNVQLAVDLLRTHIERTKKEVTAYYRRKNLKNISG